LRNHELRRSLRVEVSYEGRNVRFVVKKGGLTFVVFGWSVGVLTVDTDKGGNVQQSKALGLLREF